MGDLTPEQKEQRRRLAELQQRVCVSGSTEIARMAGDIVCRLLSSRDIPRIFIEEILDGATSAIYRAVDAPEHRGRRDIPGVSFTAVIDMADDGATGLIEIVAEIRGVPVSRARYKF